MSARVKGKKKSGGWVTGLKEGSGRLGSPLTTRLDLVTGLKGKTGWLQGPTAARLVLASGLDGLGRRPDSPFCLFFFSFSSPPADSSGPPVILRGIPCGTFRFWCGSVSCDQVCARLLCTVPRQNRAKPGGAAAGPGDSERRRGKARAHGSKGMAASKGRPRAWPWPPTSATTAWSGWPWPRRGRGEDNSEARRVKAGRQHKQ